MSGPMWIQELQNKPTTFPGEKIPKPGFSSIYFFDDFNYTSTYLIKASV